MLFVQFSISHTTEPLQFLILLNEIMMRNVLHVVPLVFSTSCFETCISKCTLHDCQKNVLDDHLSIADETLDNRKDCTMNYKTHLSTFCGEKTENCMK